jgi:hypothetical protein
MQFKQGFWGDHMARRKIIHHVIFYRVIYDLKDHAEFNTQTLLDQWYEYSPYTVPTKMMMAGALRGQPMIEIVTPHQKQSRKGNNLRAQTYRVCPDWIERNSLEDILKQSSRGKVVLK